MKNDVNIKKLSLAVILTITLAGTVGCTGVSQSKLSYIGSDTARHRALATAGLKEADIQGNGAYSISCDMFENEGVDYYRVEIEYQGDVLVYEIDALSGAIISGPPYNISTRDVVEEGVFEYESQSEAPTMEVPENTVDSLEPQVETAQEDTPEMAQQPQPALQQQPQSAPQQQPQPAPQPQPQPGLQPQQPQEMKAQVDQEKAKDIALARVPGATRADIVEFKLEYDDGIMKYEGKIIYGETEYEFEIDGYSGAILDWEAESIYD